MRANFSFIVMAPFLVEDHHSYRSKLAEANADRLFQTDYYDSIFADITEAGLYTVSIMSFH